jgi:hypothetical protein
MPFPEGTPLFLKGLYGTIEKATAARMSTAQTWEAIRRGAGGDLSGIGFRGAQTVSALRGIAARVRDAEYRLAKATGGEALDHRHVGEPPWARPIAERNAAPKYVARIEALGINPAYLEGLPGEPEHLAQWVTLNMSALPATVDDLNETIAERLAGMQTGRGQPGGYLIGPAVGVGRVQLLTV